MVVPDPGDLVPGPSGMKVFGVSMMFVGLVLLAEATGFFRWLLAHVRPS